jgi:hypothetical protein
MHKGGFPQAISDTCSQQVVNIQDILLASVPEFVGGLLTAVVAGAAAWSIRKRRKHGNEGEVRG